MKRLGAQLAFAIALIALFVALGGSAYARTSSNGKPSGAKVQAAARGKLAVVHHMAKAVDKPTVEPAPFTG